MKTNKHNTTINKQTLRRRRLSLQDWHQMSDLLFILEKWLPYTRDEKSQAKLMLGDDLSVSDG